MKKILIGKKYIGEGKPCFIIAEAGVNHNGKLDLALKLVDVASEAGADAIKFQTFKAKQVVTNVGKMAAYQEKNLGIKESQRKMLQKLELNEDFYSTILKRCKQKKIIFLSTPHGGKDSVDFLKSLNVVAYKVGSGDLTNYILLKKIAKLGKPIILSTGMATLKETKNALAFIKKFGNKKIVVLHCTTNYPCPQEEVNLAAMSMMMKKLKFPVGYSDHTEGSQTAIMAATLGATVYECHFTLDKNLPGPDHKASADPNELKQRIDVIRKVQKILGSSEKKPNLSEIKSMLTTIRRSIVANRSLSKGQVIKEKDLEAKRPGNGLSPEHFQTLIGKTAKRDIKADEQIKKRDVK